MRKKILSAIFVSVLLIGGLSGCGKAEKAEKDEIEDSLSSLQDTASDTNAYEDEAVDEGITEHLSYTVTDENGVSATVEADVVFSGFQNASIYEAKVIEIDENLLTEYADSLFDDASYDVIKPYSMFSEQELKDEREFIDKQIKAYKNSAYPDRLVNNLVNLDIRIQDYDESNVAQPVDGQLIYQEDKVHQSSPSETENVTYYSARLRGLIDGEQWELFYEAINGSAPQQSIQIYTCEGTVLSYVINMEDKTVDQYGANLSNLETSKNNAERMVERLGYENMEVIHTGQLVDYDRHNKSQPDGYKFTFARSIGTMQIGFKGNSVEMLGNAGGENYRFGVQQEYIHVYVNDNGVTMLTIDNVIEVGDTLSAEGGNSLMNFDEVDSIAKEQLEEIIGNNTDPINIDSVSLKYLVLPFEEGKNALMPVWLYYLDQPDEFSDYRYASICINAVDGSIIETSIPASSLTN